MKTILKKIFQPAKAYAAGYASDGSKNPFFRPLKRLAFEDGYQRALADKTGYKGGLPWFGSHLAEMLTMIALAEIALTITLSVGLNLLLKVML